MKKSHYLFLLSVLLLSCTSQQGNEVKQPEFSKETTDFKELVSVWNKAHSSKDVATLSNLYHSSVLFYGMKLEKNMCIEKKLSFFKKHPDFYQQIYGDIQIENQTDNSVTCSFIKRVTINQETKDYPAYLTFAKNDNEWVINTEGDLTTDKNLARQDDITVPTDAIKGDFNGDGINEYVWLVPPKFPKESSEDDYQDCNGECECYLKFSNPNIPSIKLVSCIGGSPVNEGDLNNDGADEVGILPTWWTSCWRDYLVYTLRNNKWKYAVSPFSTHCNLWEEETDVIKKDRSKKGNVIIHYSYHTGEDIVTLSKSIKTEK